MDIYRLLKLNQRIKSHRVKFFGLWLLSVLDRRFLSIQMDPVLACNLRCKMCYFTDAEFVRKNMKGMFREYDLEPMARSFFKNALKLQIGCGAEPTLFKHNTKLIALAKTHGVPYISMITNGNLINENDVEAFADAGLNEIILSVHGVKKETYEDLMDKGDFEKFHQILHAVTDAKMRFPNLRLRMNYTFNEDNFYELEQFFDVFGNYSIDIIQLRPIDKIGETTYDNFSLKKIETDYVRIASQMKSESENRNITLLYPQTVVRNEQESLKVKSKNDSSYLIPYTYFYISPRDAWKEGFDWRTETFGDWRKRTKWSSELFRNIFVSRATLDSENRNMLNYSVEIN